MPDAPFTPHEHDALPLGRNTVPVSECKIHPALQEGQVAQVVDVPLLSCSSVWLRCQQEARKWVSDCNGKILSDAMQINRRINAAYAHLWLTDRRFQWAGLAAFASKQVGCGLLHAAKTSKATLQRVRNHTGEDSADFLSRNVFDLGVGAGAEYVARQLALGNLTLFLDIYPLHRFYMLRGFEGIRSCLAEREAIKDLVFWPPEARSKLVFGKFCKEILTGFEQIEGGQISESVRSLAHHEPINILQKVIYDDPVTQKALDSNQFAWVTKLPTGDYAEIQLTLSAGCSPKLGWTQWFAKSSDVHLWNKDDRMRFVIRAADEFDRLLKGRAAGDLRKSIEEIYLLGERG
ncbi:DUF2515 family protein [Massilia endophytica]|uniref:DUF2515 family protein n=1 Tax=Massilia endophytica TaxID=2899220 RepID=UPI001E50E1F6|nr:hypothetical protein [Massilia endophytica]UGQ47627.1 hypothetical protein LSQ66_03860 [Massilia endophytica]